MCSVSVMPLQLCNMRCDVCSLTQRRCSVSRVTRPPFTLLRLHAFAMMPAHMLFARHVVVQRACVHAMQDPLTSCTAATLWVCRQKARRGMRWCFDHVHANVMLFMCCVSAGAPSRGACFPKIVALRLRKSLETSGRALTQKRKKCRGILEKGGPFSVPWSCVQG